MKRPTTAIHGGADLDRTHQPHEPVVSPLVQSVNYFTEFGTSDGLKYTRYGNTPNVQTVERRLAQLEGAESAVVLASGMGATACAMLALLRPGDHLLTSSWIYGGTRRLFAEELREWGVDVSFVDPSLPRSWKKELRKTTRAIFLESPVNPTCRVLDLTYLATLAKNEGIALVVDSTLASPINFRPLEYGADIVIHSATKYLNGHHDVLAGVVLGAAAFVDEVRHKMTLWGQAPDPFMCWLLERGLKTLAVRVQRQNENAMALAQWCAHRTEFSAVHYPGLPDHPDHELADRYLDGYGGMLSVAMKGGGESADQFVRRLRIVKHAASLGGVDTLVSEPRYTSHAHMSAQERSQAGIPDGFLRFSIGIEDIQDLIEDFEQALR